MHRAVNWSVFMQGVNNTEVVNKMSVSDKMKFFEKAMEEQHQPSPKTGKPYEVAFTYEGGPKNNENFFLEGHYFHLLPLGACTWLPSTSVGQAASLRKGLYGQCDFFLEPLSLFSSIFRWQT